MSRRKHSILEGAFGIAHLLGDGRGAGVSASRKLDFPPEVCYTNSQQETPISIPLSANPKVSEAFFVASAQRTANGHETDSALRLDIEMARFALAMCLSALF